MPELPHDESSTAAAGTDPGRRKAAAHEARGAPTFAVTSAPAANQIAANDNLVDRTIALWRHRLGREVSREEARQITENVTGFFSILHAWSRAETRAAVNDNEQPAAHEEKSHDR
jgi:hypothetical protein